MCCLSEVKQLVLHLVDMVPNDKGQTTVLSSFFLQCLVTGVWNLNVLKSIINICLVSLIFLLFKCVQGAE